MISINKKFLFFNLFWALLPAQDDPFVLDSALTDSLSQSLANTIIAADMNNDNINDHNYNNYNLEYLTPNINSPMKNNSTLNISKINEYYGYNSEYGINDGLKKTIN